MKYFNATSILPKELIEEIQKYTKGTLLYIPDDAESKSWGEISGYREYLTKRNQMIRNHFKYGKNIDEISEQYSLSKESIKKIVYGKNDKVSVFKPTTASAQEYADAGLLEEWIHTYLLYVRKNIDFSEGLYGESRYYFGPVSMPLRLFTRSSGPESHMKWIVHHEIFEKRVQEWIVRLQEKEDIPPLIINYDANEFEINCNNPLFEALTRFMCDTHPIIFWFSSKEDYLSFQKLELNN